MEQKNSEDIIKRLEQYDFKFENISFEGGGVKGISHVGMIEITAA